VDKPIGYWVREIDRRLEADFARLLADEGLTRRHWQVLNTVALGPRTQVELDGELAPFLSDDTPSTAPVVADLRERGWLEQAEPAIVLTDNGVRQHEQVSARVAANRRRLTEGISAEEYRSTVGVLERMAGNLTGGQLGR
jgi:DNA-binding MarR family transcriptional regulator